MAVSDEDDNDAWTDYSDFFRREVLPSVMSQPVFLSVGTEAAEKFDIKQATELGAALLLGKAILLVVPKGRQLNPALRRCADIVLDDWQPEDAGAGERLVRAMQQLQASA
jgi:hypothetical protein